MSHTSLSTLLVIALAMASALAEAQNERLDALFEETWAFRLQEDPLRATSVGEHAYGDRLPRVTAEDQRRRAEYYRGVLVQLDAIDRDGLSASDQLRHVPAPARRRRPGIRVQRIPPTHQRRLWRSYRFLAFGEPGPLATVADYEDYIERLKLARRYIDEHIESMREGLSIGMTVPQVVLSGYEVTIESHVVTDG